ncbi:hypothetical protein NDU88_006553 [Pleurodeles waltl]|uniref:Uncharacterized protein n=1 Tax=Pleurodeles waltl TaxID=8319 RepID=A0AAV7WB46_PLEWA|nr:hypothetical protein NDU88_006553 [Pleurodeles waltl]
MECVCVSKNDNCSNRPVIDTGIKSDQVFTHSHQKLQLSRCRLGSTVRTDRETRCGALEGDLCLVWNDGALSSCKEINEKGHNLLT